MKKYIIVMLIITFVSCKSDKKTSDTDKEEVKETVFDDSKYVLDASFKIGDVRRYGVFPDSVYSFNHPYTKKGKLETVLDLSENHGILMNFPKGYYKMNLFIKGRKNIKLNFENAEFGGLIKIIENDSIQSENIKLKGDVVSYAGLFTRKSNNININNITIKSSLVKNIYKIRSKGCHIYAGSSNVTINNLVIDDLGSGSEAFVYTHAAIAIDGWNNNPTDITIKKAHIKSTDRHGVYLTGTDNYIEELIIDKFGIGTSKFMVGMEDAAKGEEKEFAAVWINKCYDCAFDKITINEKESKGKYAAFFDVGDKTRPTLIDEMIILNDSKSIGIKRDPNTAVEATVAIKN